MTIDKTSEVVSWENLMSINIFLVKCSRHHTYLKLWLNSSWETQMSIDSLILFDSVEEQYWLIVITQNNEFIDKKTKHNRNIIFFWKLTLGVGENKVVITWLREKHLMTSIILKGVKKLVKSSLIRFGTLRVLVSSFSV